MSAMESLEDESLSCSLFLLSYGPRPRLDQLKHKKNRPIYSRLDRASLVNNAYGILPIYTFLIKHCFI